MVRMTWIDSLKGIAILFIIALHSSGENLPGHLVRLVSSGSSWVQLFLLISVALAISSARRYFESRGQSFRVCAMWFFSRILRLCPLYYVALFLASLTGGVQESSLASEGGITIANICAHLTFIHGFFPRYANSIIGVEWYVGVLVIVYLLVPFLCTYVSSLRTAFCLFVCVILCCHFTTDAAFRWVVPLAEAEGVYRAYFSVFCFLRSLPTIALGVILQRLLQFKSDGSNLDKAFSLLGFLFFVVLYRGIVRGEMTVSFLPWQALCAIVFMFLVVAVSRYPLPIVDNVFFRMLGRHSYGLYLYHMPALFFLTRCRLLSPFFNDSHHGFYVRYVMCVLLSFVLTITLERFVDAPARNLASLIRGGRVHG